MINTLNIGKYIYSTLTGCKDITCNVYPLVADNDAKFPFIVYRRVNLSSYNTKDGLTEDSVTVEIVVVSDKYSVGLDLATSIRTLLEKQSVTYDDIEINDATLETATEEYSNSSYIQKMQFNFKINK